jgi:hypothetical protein
MEKAQIEFNVFSCGLQEAQLADASTMNSDHITTVHTVVSTTDT